MKSCIVNVFSKGRENYKELTEGLLKSLQLIDFKDDVLLFSPDISQYRKVENVNFFPGWPHNTRYGECKPHTELQHGFKCMAIQAAREYGYNQILWLDSTIRVKKNPATYFDLANELGVVTFDSEEGAEEAKWTSDKCLEILGCSPEYANTFNQCYGGIMLFDFTNQRGVSLFDEFASYCQLKEVLDMSLGSTRPEFIAHRSDQSVISFLIKKYRMNNLSWGGVIYKGSKNPFNLEPTFVIGD
jgi:hypothetical protein